MALSPRRTCSPTRTQLGRSRWHGRSAYASDLSTDGATDEIRWRTRQPGPENSPAPRASGPLAAAASVGSARRKSGVIAPTTDGERKANGVACGKISDSAIGCTRC
eukprot:1651959-Prymnesium_polylepis.1